MSTQGKPFRWGIISTGGISTSFSKDLMVNPSTRDAHDVDHRIVAVGSRSTESAEKFIEKIKSQEAPYNWGVEHGKIEGCKAYADYHGVYNDPNVDAVYIGTPHPMHHRNCKDALLAGKHVLCEKPWTMNLEEMDELMAIAKEKGLFLMEAVWTRFHPIAYAVQDIIHGGKLGKVKRFTADFSWDFNPDNWPGDHRMVDPKLGGGSLLDMGPYPSVWAMLVLHHHPDNKGTTPKVVSSYQTLYPRSGVDMNSRWIVEWPSGHQASCVTDMGCTGLAQNTCAVHCEKGDLTLEFGPFKPQKLWIHPHPTMARKQGDVQEVTEHSYPVHEGGGMHYEADEVARCVRDGKLESARMPWEESRIVQGWFDQVRKEGNTVLKDYKGTAGQ